MDWSDEAFVLSSRPHGENAAIVVLLTQERGRHAGLVHGGTSSAKRGIYQPGNRVRAQWRARLAEHLGTYQAEMLAPHAALALDDPLRLAGLTSACAIADAVLPEREPHAAIFAGFGALGMALESDGWPLIYVRLELGLLQELGFGLELDRCALTGATVDLAFISPKSGRAVSAAAAGPYKEKLLPLPPILVDGPRRDWQPADYLAGLEVTGAFLEQHLFWPHGKTLPPARTRLIDRLRDMTTISSS